MSRSIHESVPDIGDFKDVPVIEVFVKVGDTVKAEEPLISLESDKATMDVPAPQPASSRRSRSRSATRSAKAALVQLLESADGAAGRPAKPSISAPPPPVNAPAASAEVRVPDIGDFKDVPVIEIYVKPGDTVKAEDKPLISLESDKATMDVPAPLGGVVQEIKRQGRRQGVSEGSGHPDACHRQRAKPRRRRQLRR
jgi:pyruvate dehydrogenase E2 component (dihydrolipoamide acetyltransferase)